jgi:hypothetical protein
LPKFNHFSQTSKSKFLEPKYSGNMNCGDAHQGISREFPTMANDRIVILDARFLTNYEPTANWMRNLSSQTGLADDANLREFMQQNAQQLVNQERDTAKSQVILTNNPNGQCSQGWQTLVNRR